VPPVAHRLTALFGSTHLSEEAFSHMKINRSNSRSHPTGEHFNIAFTCAQVIMKSLSVTFRKLCSVRHQIRNRKVEEKHLLITVNCFSLKKSVFNK